MPSNADVVVRVEGLGKRYLVPQRHDSNAAPREPGLRDQLKEFFPTLMGATERDYFWALRDVSFSIKRGEVFGIVGRNGSGKSTLLKILSRVTPPTTGRAETVGRVGSLLEVGTGFHPDLTGRQNVFFNGALLGVPQAQIREKLDDIIAFSGIGAFIDVPVKRYSSGMYVRLAYSVASLLDSDIMVLDEVLAVGDSAFRAKSEGDIRRSTEGGKTVVLVSHSPQAIVSTCDRGIILDRGRLVFSGDAKEVIGEYLSGHYASLRADAAGESPSGEETDHHTTVKPTPYVELSHNERLVTTGQRDSTRVIKWLSVHAMDGSPRAEFNTGEGVRFRIGYSGLKDPSRAYFAVLIHNTVLHRVVTASSTHTGEPLGAAPDGVVECVVPRLMLGDGLYNVMVDSGIYDTGLQYFESQDCVSHATYIRMWTNNLVKGTGVGEFQGAVHESEWRALPESRS